MKLPTTPPPAASTLECGCRETQKPRDKLTALAEFLERKAEELLSQDGAFMTSEQLKAIEVHINNIINKIGQQIRRNQRRAEQNQREYEKGVRMARVAKNHHEFADCDDEHDFNVQAASNLSTAKVLMLKASSAQEFKTALGAYLGSYTISAQKTDRPAPAKVQQIQAVLTQIIPKILDKMKMGDLAKAFNKNIGFHAIQRQGKYTKEHSTWIFIQHEGYGIHINDERCASEDPKVTIEVSIA